MLDGSERLLTTGATVVDGSGRLLTTGATVLEGTGRLITAGATVEEDKINSTGGGGGGREAVNNRSNIAGVSSEAINNSAGGERDVVQEKQCQESQRDIDHRNNSIAGTDENVKNRSSSAGVTRGIVNYINNNARVDEKVV